MKKLLLTSAIIALAIYPSYSTTVTGTGSECTEETLNTDTGPATLQAQWTANTITLEWYNDNEKITPNNSTANTCTYDSSITLPTNNPTKEGYTFGGWQVRQTLDLMALIGTGAGTSRAYINNSGSFSENNASYGQSYYGINSKNTWAVDYGSSKGMLIGAGRCSTTPGTANWSEPYSFSTETNIADETGQTGARYCYCNVTGYKDGSGNLQSLSSAWVFDYDFRSVSDCTSYCVSLGCLRIMNDGDSSSLAFRATVLGSVQ